MEIFQIYDKRYCNFPQLNPRKGMGRQRNQIMSPVANTSTERGVLGIGVYLPGCFHLSENRRHEGAASAVIFFYFVLLSFDPCPSQKECLGQKTKRRTRDPYISTCIYLPGCITVFRKQWTRNWQICSEYPDEYPGDADPPPDLRNIGSLRRMAISFTSQFQLKLSSC